MNGQTFPICMNDAQEELYNAIIKMSSGMTYSEIKKVLDIVIKTVETNSIFEP